MTFPIFDPTVAPDPDTFAPAPRPSSLRGKTVGLLDNGKACADRLLDELARLLQVEHGVARVVRRRKASAYAPAADELIGELAGAADLVVTGVGD
jgi:hypothetical protein